MKETEIKFSVKNIMELRPKLKKLGAELVWKGSEENYFFDTPSGKLRKERKNFRLRRWSGCSDTMTLKTVPNRKNKKLKVRNEYQIEISDIKTAKKILHELGYREYMGYKKYREHWVLNGACVELDKLKGFHFVEIEASPRRINFLANKLGVGKNDSTTDGYLTILGKIRKNR